MRACIFAAAVVVLLVVATPGAQRGESDATQLPVRRVILYKSGVGYFEHLGSVTGSADVAVQFTSGQLNDVLKSLTALDLDNGRIANISYNSIAPIEQRLGALRLPLGADPDPLQLYNVLRGARVDVHGATTTATGRLLGAERRQRTRAGASESVDELTVITDEGSVRTIPLGADVTVHIGERDVREELSRYLSVLASGRDQDVRRMVIATSGTGTRRLFVSYISEVPIWKSTYRLVLPEQANARPLLQGWAIVDNTVGEDWNNVELSLVAGAPQSFIQEISQPYYARRPVVPLPEAVLLAPQTHAATLQAGDGSVHGRVRDNSGGPLPGVTITLVDDKGNEAANATTDANGDFDVEASPGTYRLRMRLTGFTPAERTLAIRGGMSQRVDGVLNVGGLSETVTVSAESPAMDALQGAAKAPATRLRGGVAGGVVGGVVGGRSGAPAALPFSTMQVATSAQDLGDLFEYRLKEPVTIRKNESALVPILSAQVEAERVSLWNRGPGSGRPLRAVWLTNATGMTLDAGTFSVVDANAFAGEGLVEALKPGEKRLVSYATDLGVLVDAKLDDASGRVTRVSAHDGIFIASQEERARWNYRIRNEDTTARTIIVEHPIRAGWKMASAPAAAESTAAAARYRLSVDSKKEATLAVTELRAGDTRYSIGDIDDRLILSLVQRGLPGDALRKALQPVLDKRAEVAALEARLAGLGTQVSSIGQDQQRLRENMKALRGSDEEKALLQRYTRELNAQEDRLAELQAEITKASAERDQKRAELARLIQQTSFEIGGA